MPLEEAPYKQLDYGLCSDVTGKPVRPYTIYQTSPTCIDTKPEFRRE